MLAPRHDRAGPPCSRIWAGGGGASGSQVIPSDEGKCVLLAENARATTETGLGSLAAALPRVLGHPSQPLPQYTLFLASAGGNASAAAGREEQLSARRSAGCCPALRRAGQPQNAVGVLARPKFALSQSSGAGMSGLGGGCALSSPPAMLSADASPVGRRSASPDSGGAPHASPTHADPTTACLSPRTSCLAPRPRPPSLLPRA